MKEIPGSAPSGDENVARAHATLSDKTYALHRPLPEWATKRRWPEGPPAPEFFTTARKRAQRYKRHEDHELHAGALSGHELTRGFRSGRSKRYTLDRPKTGVVLPVDANWKLRGTYREALEWIAYSHVVRKRTGLNATYLELGEVCDLGPDRMYQVLRTLRSWNLVGCNRSFEKPRGAVSSSQRANTWYLTRVAAYAFGLPNPETYRDPDEDAPPPPAAKPTRRSASLPEKTTRHSESPRVLSNSRENIARTRTRASCGAVSPAAPATPDSRKAVPAESTVPSLPAISRESCSVSRPALQAGVAESAHDATVAPERDQAAAHRIGDALSRVRRRHDDERERPNPEAPRDTREIARRRGAEGRDDELVADRELERLGGDAQDLAGDVTSASSAIAAAKPDDSAPASINGRVPLDDVDEDLRKVLENANASFERRRHQSQAWMRNRRKPGGAS